MQRGKRSVPLAKTEIDRTKRQFLDVHFYILLLLFYNNRNGKNQGLSGQPPINLCWFKSMVYDMKHHDKPIQTEAI
jgi:hypothetical protein